jgi:hypothetical protein
MLPAAQHLDRNDDRAFVVPAMPPGTLCGQKTEAAESTVSYPPPSLEIPQASPVHFNERDGGRRKGNR